MKKYSKTHEWVLPEGKVAIVGITNHAQELLGDVVYVDLPEAEKEIKKGEILCSVESVKAASDVYSPVSGKIKEVNGTLDSSPELINSSAEDEAWIVKIEIKNPDEIKDLISFEEYKMFIAEE